MSRRQHAPIVTLLLIVANLFAAFALLLSPELIPDLGFHSNKASIVQSVTSLFLHANILHLLGNMIFLAAVGAAVELATGSVRFVIVYFVSGLGGVAVHYLFTRDVVDPSPLIGASGCVAGCAAYYNVRYTKLKVALAPHVSMSVLAVTALWLALQLAGIYVRIGETRGVAFYAHIGGFLSGILLSAAFRAPDFAQLDLKHEALARMNDRGPDAMIEGALAHLAEHPNDVAALRHLVDAYRTLGETSEEIDVLLRLIEIEPVSADLHRLGQLKALGRIPIQKREQFAEQMKREAPDTARSLLESVLRDSVDTPRHADALLAMVAFEREHHADRAQVLLRELARDYPLHPATELARKREWIT